MERLVKIQKELKAPKNQYNSFGKYKYRSTEDIMEGLKPLLSRENLTLVVSDEVVAIGSRFYVKATCIVSDKEKELARNTAFAREADTKKGMDVAQVTGAASSYARKYALSGLFLCDDTKDTDSYDNQQQQQQSYNNPVQQQPQQQVNNHQVNNQQTQSQQQSCTQPAQTPPPAQNNADIWENGRNKLTEWCMTNPAAAQKWFDYYKIKGTNDLTHDQIKHMGSIVFKK